jgi:microsomal dipeptidase-like Zn-dependent dipeptidase
MPGQPIESPVRQLSAWKPDPAEPFDNASFEAPRLDGWTILGRAIDPSLRRCGGEAVANVRAPNLPSSMPLGGDYWRVPLEGTRTIGAEGYCYLSTPQGAPVVSPMFRAARQFLRLLARTKESAVRGTVEIQTAAGATLVRKDIPQGDQMQEMVFDLFTIPEAQRGALRVAVLTTNQSRFGSDIDGVRLYASVPPYTVPASVVTAPLWGFADMHTHPMAHLAHDGKWLVGANDGPMHVALASCPANHGTPSNPIGGGFNKKIAIDNTEAAPGRGGIEGHNDKGFPSFEGWPLHTSILHQQMYVDWIRRAWQGGLRLMVAHMGAYEMFDRLATGIRPFDDRVELRRLLQEMKWFVERHGDFMEIAYSPADARRIILAGKLAIVLGIEVDSFAGCKADHPCTRDDILREVAELHALGIRHIVPIGHADNALGGSALYQPRFNLNNYLLNGKFYVPDPNYAPPGNPADRVHFRLLPVDKSRTSMFFAGIRPAAITRWEQSLPPIPLAAINVALDIPAYPQDIAHVNLNGLFDFGKAAIEEMLRLGMIVDVDHMGLKSTQGVYAIARRRNQPVAAGHAGLRVLNYTNNETDEAHKMAHEGNRGDSDLATIAFLGGLVAPITAQGDVKKAPDSRIPSDCQDTAKSWVQAYIHVVARTGKAAIGTDFNGFVSQPGPRFGPFACVGRNKELGNTDADVKRLRDPDTSTLWPNARKATRAEVDSQQHGVAYTTVPYWNNYLRFANDNGDTCKWTGFPPPWTSPQGFGRPPDRCWPYDYEEVAMWEALITWRAGKPADSIMQRYGIASTQPYWRDAPLNFVRGLYANALEADYFGNHYVTERNAAYLAKTGATLPTKISPAPRTDDLAGKLRSVYLKWEAMQRSPNAAAPLVRSTAGEREFDINLDGLAHYGMLPDFLQDVSNLLRTSSGPVTDLRALFRSAEDYIQMWERVEAGKGP